MQECERKLENIATNFQVALERQTAAIMNSMQKMMETMFTYLINLLEISKQSSSPDRKTRASLMQQKFDASVPGGSHNIDDTSNNIDIG
ncbi:hypothetical protein TNIN_249751 [Trichonephila inaurata madagascariensis]|uniref:Uncharacterized protein n=1 Tax=Trichonephila inaurata madagascariensis TaxID=2747483 RepID=A0A8X6YJY7_9ARAC|nr:hypothetical protein TNIN_249751 [Trichonephila inaurata madagascariensis]